MRLLAAALLALATLSGLLPGAARAEVPVPALKARVTDLTGTLNAQQKAELEARIAAYETRRGSQIAVLILPTTRPEEIEQYSMRVAEAWRIGRKGIDDGLLLTVAKDDRRLRIEVGYGLEGVIPDSAASRVIEERIVPRFREGDFYGGIRDGVDQLIRLAEGEKLPAPAEARGGQARGDPFVYVVPAIIFCVVVGSILKAVLGRLPGSLATGATLGVLSWFLFGLGFAVLGFIVGFFLTLTNTGRGGGWSSGSGGSSGGGSWGGGSSGGSWGGGGGGGFGGGGASGRW
jgi:uncharacterized protein